MVRTSGSEGQFNSTHRPRARPLFIHASVPEYTFACTHSHTHLYSHSHSHIHHRRRALHALKPRVRRTRHPWMPLRVGSHPFKPARLHTYAHAHSQASASRACHYGRDPPVLLLYIRLYTYVYTYIHTPPRTRRRALHALVATGETHPTTLARALCVLRHAAATAHSSQVRATCLYFMRNHDC